MDKDKAKSSRKLTKSPSKDSKKIMRRKSTHNLPAADPEMLKALVAQSSHLQGQSKTDFILSQLKQANPTITIPDQAPRSRATSAADNLPKGPLPAVPFQDRHRSTEDQQKNIMARISTASPLARTNTILGGRKLPPAPQENRPGSLRGTGSLRKGSVVPIAKRKEESKKTPTEIEKVRQQKQEIRRKAEAMERDDTEWLEKLETGDEVPKEDDVLEPMPDFPFDDYRFVYQLASSLNGVGVVPEIVIVGMNSTGKSQLLEAIIGKPINLVGYKEGGKTKHPLFVHLDSNEMSPSPKCTLLSVDKRGETLDVSDVPAALKKNSDMYFSAEPINLQYEYSKCLNILLIDLPGLPVDSDSDEYGQIEIFLSEFLRSPHRLILCVEDTNQKDWDTSGGTDIVRQLVKKVDPYQKRTFWVHTKLNSFIEGQHFSSMEVSRYLNQSFSPDSFWVTLLSQQEHESAYIEDNFLSMLGKVEARDKSSLDSLRIGSSILKNVGITALRKRILAWCWHTYFETEVPRLFKQLATLKKQADVQIATLEGQISGLNLKRLASQFATRFINLSQSIFSGSARGNPSVNGETMREELDEQFFASAEWELPPGVKIPYENTKVYGGQQLERVFAEFRAIVDHLSIEDTSGLPSLQDKKFLHQACELIQARTEDILNPLIQQLIDRCAFVMKRVPDIATFIMGSKENALNGNEKLEIDYKHYTPLATYLKDLFATYVEKNAKFCGNEANEEFYTSKTLLWFLSEEVSFETLADEATALTELFNTVKERIATNALRKVYNFFLLPFFKEDLWDEIQTHIFKMDTTTLEEIFEVNSIEDGLEHDLEQLEATLEKLHNDEISLHSIVPRITP